MDANDDARRLALLGIILQSLHILFGITAIIGVLIAHTHLESTRHTVYHSQLRWQIITFWTAFTAYFGAFWLWLRYDTVWAIALVTLFVAYRLAVSIQHWRLKREILRGL